MYLHIGKNRAVLTKNIIGVFDLDNSTVSKWTRDYLSKAQKEGRVVDVSQELPRSFLVIREKNREMIYLSQLSPKTLLKRAVSKSFEDQI